jgi:hypothetical protein
MRTAQKFDEETLMCWSAYASDQSDGFLSEFFQSFYNHLLSSCLSCLVGELKETEVIKHLLFIDFNFLLLWQSISCLLHIKFVAPPSHYFPIIFKLDFIRVNIAVWRNSRTLSKALPPKYA